jgi:hypothetical protein
VKIQDRSKELSASRKFRWDCTDRISRLSLSDIDLLEEEMTAILARVFPVYDNRVPRD